jgi:putative glycosyltransferase (TIGR04372 family)
MLQGIYKNMNGKLATYVKSQMLEYSRGGRPVLIRKLHNRLMWVCCVPLLIVAFPVVVIVRALRPLVIIRFGRLNTERIGHMTTEIEFYLCEREAMSNNLKTVEFFYYELPIANKQLFRMWRRTLRVSRLVYPLWRCNGLLPGGELHEIELRGDNFEEAGRLLLKSDVHIKFTPEEEVFGSKCLREMGIGASSEFVCFHARESSYLKKVFPGTDFKYHDFRDSDIRNFFKAVEEMANRGYFGVRLGKYIEVPISINNSRIIDYSTKFRTDFLDIFLLAKCRFLIGSNTGITDVAYLFRKPIVKTNMTQFFGEIPLAGEKDLFIPKKYWLKEERRNLSFREIFDSPVSRLLRSEQLEQAGIELIENTEEELLDITVEMDKRLKGTWESTEEDEALQERFWSIIMESDMFVDPAVSRIGAMFIRQNQYLLE